MKNKYLLLVIIPLILVGCSIKYGIVATTYEEGEENILKDSVGKSITEVDTIMRDSFSQGLAVGVEIDIYIQDGFKDIEGSYMNKSMDTFFDGGMWKPEEVKFNSSKKYNSRIYVGTNYTKFPTSYIGLGFLDLDTTDVTQCWVLWETSTKIVSHIFCGIKKDDTKSHLMTFADPPEGVMIIKK